MEKSTKLTFILSVDVLFAITNMKLIFNTDIINGTHECLIEIIPPVIFPHNLQNLSRVLGRPAFKHKCIPWGSTPYC